MAVAIVCAVCSITINPGKVQAADFWPEAPDVQSASAIVMEASTGEKQHGCPLSGEYHQDHDDAFGVGKRKLK